MKSNKPGIDFGRWNEAINRRRIYKPKWEPNISIKEGTISMKYLTHI